MNRGFWRVGRDDPGAPLERAKIRRAESSRPTAWNREAVMI